MASSRNKLAIVATIQTRSLRFTFDYYCIAVGGVPRVSRARGQSQLRRPHQPIHDSIDAKSELSVKGHQKMTRAP